MVLLCVVCFCSLYVFCVIVPVRVRVRSRVIWSCSLFCVFLRVRVIGIVRCSCSLCVFFVRVLDLCPLFVLCVRHSCYYSSSLVVLWFVFVVHVRVRCACP